MKPMIYPSSIETVRALILHIIKQLNDEPERIFYMALSGGNTPALMFDLWAHEYKDVTPWQRMKIFFVDERCVPTRNSESNYGMIRSLLLDPVGISYENVFPIWGEEQPDKEAVRYSEITKEVVPQHNGLPQFDLVLLGAGIDGHTSSIFPGQEELLSSNHCFEASYHTGSGQKRIAMTGLPILNARRVIFLITGKDKARVVGDIFHSGDIGPAAYIAHHSAHVELFVDEAAASLI